MDNRNWSVALAVLVAALVVAAVALVPAPAGAASQHLTRYPYLTDVVRTGGTVDATVNWATDQSQTTGYATYGQAGIEASGAHTVTATRTTISVNGVPEYQWMARISGLEAGSTYAYRTFLGDPGVELLAGDADLQFTTPSADLSATYSFAVMGDWGANPSGSNPDQANLDAQVARSGASFVLSAGDAANPAGSQSNYGDLFQTGADTSNVFGPAFYKSIGDGMPMFGAPGNHGFNSTFLDVWPEATAPALSAGRYQMDRYSVPGTNAADYPSVWYAFTVGSARFYVLTAAWANSNVGTGTLYSNDYAAHWEPTSPEYQWLANDLATHPAAVKFAVFHFPMYSDNATETTDTYLHGPDSLAALLSRYDVQFVFNGHAHIYERNLKQPGESFVSYVTGGGGSPLEPVNRHGSFDAYALGWSPSTGQGSASGSAPVPTSPAQVYSFLLVTVSPGRVTVTPVDSLGRAFDVQTYPMEDTSPPVDTTPPTISAGGVPADSWLRATATLHLAAGDGAGSGVKSIAYSVDGGDAVRVPAASVDVSVTAQGLHKVTYWATDLAGNESAHTSLSFGIDTQAPSTTSDGDGRWHNRPVTLSFVAQDAVSGVLTTESRVDTGAWRSGTSRIIPAPSDHSWDGVHTVRFRSVDAAGNVETTHTISARVDTRAPSTRAPRSAWVRRGRTVGLFYRVSDAAPSAGRARVEIKIRTFAGRLVKTLKVGWRPVGRASLYSFRCTLPRGSYRFRVYATDSAGNRQVKAAGNRLVVR